MRIAIVDDIETERALLKMRLERQLSLYGVETEILEFDSSESFLAAEKERHFTVAFLDIYMKGLSGMDAAKELRKTDADCFLIFTTTSTDHALEGFQVRAFHYLVKPFSEGELAGLLTEMLAKLPRPEPILTVKVSGSDVRLRYRDIIFAEHFAHMINIRTTAGKTLATRQSFKAFTEPLKKDPQSPGKLAARILPLMAGLCIGAGIICYQRHASTASALAGITLLAIGLYTGTLQISLWKSGTIALTVCAVFACINSLSRAISVMIALHMQLPQDEPWFCLAACVFYNVVCWILVLAAFYPSTHAVRVMVEDDNFAQTWYVFWVLPLVFIFLNLFMIPRYQTTLRTGRVLQGYIVISIALLLLLLWFNAIFLLMATSLNRNARLQQENQLLFLQQQRYENLKAAIEEVRQARHDMRHQLNQITALAETGDLEGLKSYLEKTISRIPNLGIHFCENRAADSVIGYYCALAKREDIPFCAKLDLPQTLPIDEINMCLVLSNLLENALEASIRTAPDRRQIKITAYLHAGRLLLIEVENAYDGEIREKDGVFQSSKRRGNGVGIQSIQHIAEKSGGASTFAYQNGAFCAKVMLCG